jgi:transcriptional regulator GlxA family with amidase domain
LARTYPHVEVDPDSLLVEDGRFITGAGISAGIDLGLALMESDHGQDVATGGTVDGGVPPAPWRSGSVQRLD